MGRSSFGGRAPHLFPTDAQRPCAPLPVGRAGQSCAPLPVGVLCAPQVGRAGLSCAPGGLGRSSTSGCADRIAHVAMGKNQQQQGK